MPPHLLADDSDGWMKILVPAVIGVIWLIGQAMAAANKLAKKPPTRPTPFGSPTSSAPLQPNVAEPPSFLTIGRPGGPATSLADARRLAQARAAQASAAQARAAQLRQATARRPAPVAPPPRPRAPLVQATPPRVPTPPAPPARPAPAAAATAAAVTLMRNAAAVGRPATPGASGVFRSRMLPPLTPQYLRSQFILTEILRPPVALREGGNY